MSTLRKFKQEQLVGLIVVLLLHGVGLYGLWSYHIIPTPDEAVTLMVNFINPSAPEPEPPKPPEPEPPKLRRIEPPTPQQLVVQAPVVLPNEPVAPPPPPEPVVIPPPAPLALSQVTSPPESEEITNELAVMCPVRTPAFYPLASRRLNEQGKTILRIELDDEGKILNTTIKKSSGFARLDQAALAAMKAWRCKPSSRKDLVVRTAVVPFSFLLDGAE